MDFSSISINLKIRRFNQSDKPVTTEKVFEVYPNLDYQFINLELYKACDAAPEKQVLKIRNSEGFLIPVALLVENTDPFYIIDVATISCFGKNTNSLLQDAYVDAVCNKVKSLESRIAQAELVLPQLEWRRQSNMEETVLGLLNKVQFLNRRFDELYPKYKAGKIHQELSTPLKSDDSH